MLCISLMIGGKITHEALYDNWLAISKRTVKKMAVLPRASASFIKCRGVEGRCLHGLKSYKLLQSPSLPGDVKPTHVSITSACQHNWILAGQGLWRFWTCLKIQK